MPNLVRVTMFKIPEKANVEKLLELYKILGQTAVKDSKPYILSLQVGPAQEDARSQGYTVVAKSEFKDKEDMLYYDTDCEGHKTLKFGAKDLGVQGMMTVYFTPEVVFGSGD